MTIAKILGKQVKSLIATLGTSTAVVYGAEIKDRGLISVLYIVAGVVPIAYGWLVKQGGVHGVLRKIWLGEKDAPTR